jgi:hypothetical protein
MSMKMKTGQTLAVWPVSVQWWSCRESKPTLYQEICLPNCQFIPFRPD